jgi:LmbE family N-acetylglucosaminyl deacetylase
MPTQRIAVTPDSAYTGAWTQLVRTLPDAPPERALGVGPGDVVLVIGAHPDDETLGAGASIAALSRAGVRVHALSMSSGEAALDHVGRSPDGLAACRAREYAAACAALGVVRASIAGLPDGHLAEHAPRLVSVILEASDRVGADCLLTVWWDDPHPDHQAVGRATLAAGAATGRPVAGYPVWAQHWSDPGRALHGARVQPMRVDPFAERARTEAVACYRSQTEPLDDDLLPVVPREVVGWRPEMVLAS